MPTSSEFPLVFWRGEDVELNFSPPEATTITGWSLLFTIADTTGTSVLSGSTSGGEITITDATAGEFTVEFTRAQTSDLDAGMYVWDVFRNDSGSNWRLAGGILTVPRSARAPA